MSEEYIKQALESVPAENKSINEPLSMIWDTKWFQNALDLLLRAAGSAPAAEGYGAQPGSRSEVGCTPAG